jgi:hypothetical protein
MYCRFADIVFKFINERKLRKSFLCEFETARTNRPDMCVAFKASRSLSAPAGEIKINESAGENLRLLMEPQQGGYSFYLEREDSRAVICRLDVDSEWKRASMHYVKTEPQHGYLTLGVLGNLLIRNKIVPYGGLAMHASAIIHEGKGMMFTAPSGTGKSTHASLWEMYYGATVINDDCPPIRIIDGTPYVFGSPWSGSSAKFANKMAKLHGIVILEQSKQNVISPIGSSECAAMLLPRCYMPYYDVNMMDIAMKSLENIIKTVPVYLLKCRPDKEAVDLVFDRIIQSAS